ncbi:MAG TPA: hypothetical protein VJX68_06385 [Candidatus Binatus sp.]|uniref:hypothetical protein n=1 Tax=Candidatus Binatus sp. TaxID=2811406 RepID=UPI002B4926D9|nr:hypothetical protein [Candidatus Binatus sp.]HKN12809.1 hypothetical protein [Candidatus Binatus sp.]
MDETEFERAQARKLFRAILWRAFADLNALVHGEQLRDEDEVPWTAPQRRVELVDLRDWFLVPDPSPCSLDLVCEMLGLDADGQRAKARQILAGRRVKRRRRLSPEQLRHVRAALAAGETTRTIGDRLNCDQSTIRKARIRFRREGRKYAAA